MEMRASILRSDGTPQSVFGSWPYIFFVIIFHRLFWLHDRHHAYNRITALLSALDQSASRKQPILVPRSFYNQRYTKVFTLQYTFCMNVSSLACANLGGSMHASFLAPRKLGSYNLRNRRTRRPPWLKPWISIETECCL